MRGSSSATAMLRAAVIFPLAVAAVIFPLAVRDYRKATGQLGLKSQRRASEMSQNAGSEEAERHGTRLSALFLGILSTQSRIGLGCLAPVSRGKVIKIVAPRRPSSVPAAITPPWASMMRLAMAMPSPVPWVLVV